MINFILGLIGCSIASFIYGLHIGKSLGYMSGAETSFSRGYSLGRNTANVREYTRGYEEGLNQGQLGPTTMSQA